MMSGRLLLDTNAVISLFNGEGSIKPVLESAEKLFIATIVVGELYYGAFNSTKIEENTKKIDELIENVEVVECNLETAKHYAEIKKKLRDNGTKINENDIWIAALAKQHNLTLLSRDNDFTNIEDINLKKW